MARENAELVSLAHARLNDGDVEGLIELCDEGFVMDMSERVFNPDTYKGPEGIRRFYDGVQAVWQTYQWHVEETLDADDVVVAMLHCEAEGHEPGLRVDWEVAWLWRFRDGVPVSLRFYRDRERALEAAGLGQ